MKKRTVHTLVPGLAVLVLALTAYSTCGNVIKQEYWDFEGDSLGDGLKDLTNSGDLNSEWNFNTTTQNDEADGTGLFVLSGDSGKTTRKLPAADYASPVTTGKYLLEIDFASWNVSSASVGDSWSFKLNQSAAAGGTTIAQVIWHVDSASSIRLRASTTATDGSKFRNFTGYSLVENDAPTLGVEFDFDNDTVRYLLNGVEEYSFDNFNGVDIGQLLYVKNGDGTDDWANAATSLSLEEMGFSIIPEPSSFALIFSAGLGILLLRRRLV